jgi:hypothetical protein
MGWRNLARSKHSMTEKVQPTLCEENSTPSNLVGLSASPIAPDAFTYPIRDVILRANGTIS